MVLIRTLILISILFVCVIARKQSDDAHGIPAIASIIWMISKKIQKIDWEDIIRKLDKKGLSEECRDDVVHLEQEIVKIAQNAKKEFRSNMTVVQLMDASTKIPSGVMDGKIIWTGLVQQCLSISQKMQARQRLLQGSYCRIHLAIPKVGCASSVQEQLYEKPMLGLDVCIPKSCEQELQSFAHKHVPFTEVCDVHCMEEESRLTFGSYVVLGILGTCLTISLVGTLIDYYIVDPQLTHSAIEFNFWIECILCFSLYSNIRDVFSTTQKPGQITMLNGVRAFTIAWVIAGHVLLVYLMMSDNSLVIKNITNDFNMMWLVNAYFSVDTFFYITGFLIGFLFFKQAKTDKNFAFSISRWFMYYLHRLVRISPAYYIVIAFHTWVTPELLRKSVLAFTYYPLDSCKRIWWRNFLYISNYKDLDNTCYISSWYLSTDFQIFAFTPVVLIMFAHNRYGGFFFSIFLLVTSFMIHFATMVIYHFPPTDAPANSLPKDPLMTEPFSSYTLLIYDAPWIRCPPYLIGIMLGYYMQTTKKLRISRILNMTLLALCGIIMFGLIHILYHYFQGHLIPIYPRAIYSAVSKPLWGLCLAYLTYACYHGYGGIINDFLSLPIFIPVARLSYSIYLLHMSILFWMGSLYGQRYILSSYTQMIVTHFIPAFCLTTCAAVLLCAIFEIGVAKLESKLLGIDKKTTDSLSDHKTKRF
ncbi:unnamed protein product [Auanema sp. JU1783]|nr:unnamed protein product [Auanema sp. JU1783]